MQNAECKMKNQEKEAVPAARGPFFDFTFCILHFAFFF
jgi:hypothetical protein